MAEYIYEYIEGKNDILTGELVRCKYCKYYDDIEDTARPGYRECHYFSNWSTAYYMLPEDYCSCAKSKR